MEEKISNQVVGETSSSDAVVKGVTNVLKKVSVGALESEANSTEIGNEAKFKVCTSKALAKPTAWGKIKNALFTEIRVELTPAQQKVENEINEFLHQEITWQSFKDFWTQEIKITL